MNDKCPYSKNKICSACGGLKITCDGTRYINCEQYLDTSAEPNTCEYCKHLYYNNDGSVSCDSLYSKACLTTKRRRFKEVI